MCIRDRSTIESRVVRLRAMDRVHKDKGHLPHGRCPLTPLPGGSKSINCSMPEVVNPSRTRNGSICLPCGTSGRSLCHAARSGSDLVPVAPGGGSGSEPQETVARVRSALTFNPGRWSFGGADSASPFMPQTSFLTLWGRGVSEIHLPRNIW